MSSFLGDNPGHGLDWLCLDFGNCRLDLFDLGLGHRRVSDSAYIQLDIRRHRELVCTEGKAVTAMLRFPAHL
jgi:hypothetical protein